MSFSTRLLCHSVSHVFLPLFFIILSFFYRGFPKIDKLEEFKLSGVFNSIFFYYINYFFHHFGNGCKDKKEIQTDNDAGGEECPEDEAEDFNCTRESLLIRYTPSSTFFHCTLYARRLNDNKICLFIFYSFLPRAIYQCGT